ncbi:hypothetical protein TCAL_09782 [Tigriopus californicus]|uniref:Uncharacterized protein n=2 Tax=Tigriopus californicus TaxID=6832 RepID=A0A553PJM3_TIGCA|nr:hypothetical protein TCAL_09782 [Tigriopus californicus]
MRIQVNSTNSPLNLEDFPVVTFCPNNVLSREKAKKANKTDADIRTVLDYKQYAQSCSHFMRTCTFYGIDCQSFITQVITDMGWCCQLDVMEVMNANADAESGGIVGLMGLDVIFDIESYNYMMPNCYFEGIVFRAIPRGSYPNMLSKFTAISPGATAYVNMKLVKIFTTDDAREKSIKIRNCVFQDEITLDNFDVYTQDNCYTDQIINQFKEKCGCIGIYRGYNTSDVISAAGCPSQCLAPCQEDQISLEISTGATPGFQALCGREPTPDDKLSCLLNFFGRPINDKLCETLDMFADDEYELYSRARLCDKTFQEVHRQCNTTVPHLKPCLQALNLSVSDRRHVEEVIYDYTSSSIMEWSFLFLTYVLALVRGETGQYALDRSYFNNENLMIPHDILECYKDRDVWDRYHRLPSSVDSLVSLIRKIELDPRLTNWNPGHLAATLIHKYRFDGIQYDRCIDTSFTGAVPYKLDLVNSFSKMALVRLLISGNRDDFPTDVLTKEESCSLHWMLSYSVNTTFRDDEVFWNDNYNNNGNGYWGFRPPYGMSPGGWNNNPGNCEERKPISRSPWEMGVIWSPAGPVAAGTMLSGLAAGLEPQYVDWSNGQVDNAWAATLASDLGQTSLLKRRDGQFVGPDGYFNSTLCPREFYMRLVGTDAMYSHLTVAEINGGVDGLIMGKFADEWQAKSEFTLSQIVDRYYSVGGMVSHDVSYSSCDRYANYRRYLDGTKLKEQALIFGMELKHILLLVSMDVTAIRASIESAKHQLESKMNELDASLDQFGECAEKRKRERSFDSGKFNVPPIDEKFPSAGYADVAMILDTSIYSIEDEVFMKQVAASLAIELDIWNTRVRDDNHEDVIIQAGSHFELSEGKRGTVLLSSEDSHNKAQLACDILSTRIPQTGDSDPLKALEAAASRLSARRRDRDEANDLSYGKAQVIVMVLFTRMSTTDERALHNAIYGLRQSFPDVRLLVATRWVDANSFSKYVLFPEYDVITLSSINQEQRAEVDGRRLGQRIAQLPGQIQYSNCDPDGNSYDPERLHEVILYVLPNTQRYFRIHPRYFLKSYKLQVIIEVEFNSAEICWSRASPEEITLNEFYDVFDNDLFELDEQCNSINGGNSGSRRLTLSWDKPCQGKSITRCRPIFMKIVGKDSGGQNCLTDDHYPCRSADAAKVTLRHDGMTCGTPSVFLCLWLIALGLLFIVILM